MTTFEVDLDMDHAGIFNMRELFKDLARSADDVCLDLSQVGFLNSAGVDEMVSLSEALRRRSLTMSIAHAHGQPLRVLHQLRLDSCAGPLIDAPNRGNDRMIRPEGQSRTQ